MTSVNNSNLCRGFSGLVAMLSILQLKTITAESGGSVGLPMKIMNQARRLVNLNGMFGSQTQGHSAWERVMNAPVYQVTTTWGAAYMGFEPVEPSTDKAAVESARFEDTNRQVMLYYMDVNDAIATRDEMSQMATLSEENLSLLTTSLGKALRQATVLGEGMPSGAPFDKMKGSLKKLTEGGSFRHKIVPSRKELFYASRCKGKERVGLFGDDLDLLSSFATDSTLKQVADVAGSSRERRAKAAREAKVPHNRKFGYIGIPVFYAPGLKRRHSLLKQVASIGKSTEEKPMFLSYEDLVRTWGEMRRRNKDMPIKPDVEVFSLLDVLTAMDREQCSMKKSLVGAVKGKLGMQSKGMLQDITFIPSSESVRFKEQMRAKGNGKARLRPMR